MNGRDCIFNYQALILNFHLSHAKKPLLIKISSSGSNSVKVLCTLPLSQLCRSGQLCSSVCWKLPTQHHGLFCRLTTEVAEQNRAESSHPAVHPSTGCESLETEIAIVPARPIYQHFVPEVGKKGTLWTCHTSGENHFGKPVTHQHSLGVIYRSLLRDNHSVREPCHSGWNPQRHST